MLPSQKALSWPLAQSWPMSSPGTSWDKKRNRCTRQLEWDLIKSLAWLGQGHGSIIARRWRWLTRWQCNDVTTPGKRLASWDGVNLKKIDYKKWPSISHRTIRNLLNSHFSCLFVASLLSMEHEKKELRATRQESGNNRKSLDNVIADAREGPSFLVFWRLNDLSLSLPPACVSIPVRARASVPQFISQHRDQLLMVTCPVAICKMRNGFGSLTLIWMRICRCWPATAFASPPFALALVNCPCPVNNKRDVTCELIKIWAVEKKPWIFRLILFYFYYTHTRIADAMKKKMKLPQWKIESHHITNRIRIFHMQ